MAILQYSCLENPVDRRAWWAIVHRVAKSWTRLKQLTVHAYMPPETTFLYRFFRENSMQRAATVVLVNYFPFNHYKNHRVNV